MFDFDFFGKQVHKFLDRELEKLKKTKERPLESALQRALRERKEWEDRGAREKKCEELVTSLGIKKPGYDPDLLECEGVLVTISGDEKLRSAVSELQKNGFEISFADHNAIGTCYVMISVHSNPKELREFLLGPEA